MNNTTVKIENRNELIGFLRAIGTQCRFVVVQTETIVANMPQGKPTGRKIPSPKTGNLIQEKTANPYVGTIKVCKRNGFINADFVTAVEKRYAALHNLKPSEVEYTPGEVWYHHCMTEENKVLCLCEHNKDASKKYLQFFPVRNLGETEYFHPTLGKLTKAQIEDMEAWMYPDNKPEWKPSVLTIAIDSIRWITFRQVTMKNDTVSRLTGRLAKWKKVQVSTQAPAVAVVQPE